MVCSAGREGCGSFARSLIRSFARLASLRRYLFVCRRHPPCVWRFLSRRLHRCMSHRRRPTLVKINSRYVFAVFHLSREVDSSIPKAWKQKKNKYDDARWLSSVVTFIKLQIIRKLNGCLRSFNLFIVWLFVLMLMPKHCITFIITSSLIGNVEQTCLFHMSYFEDIKPGSYSPELIANPVSSD